MSALILVAEDSLDIQEILAGYLDKDGFRVVTACDGETALQHHLSLKPDLVLLDVGLPKRNGWDVLAELRRRGDTPVIMATALADDIDRLAGLRMGADDYVVKPFNPAEVVARVRAVLRRGPSLGGAARVLRLGALEVDLDSHSASVATPEGRRARIETTAYEMRILVHFMRAPAKVFSRSEILDACFEDSDALERTIDSHISNLRRKLMAASEDGPSIENVRGVGYKLVGKSK
jgi:two-component system, OmpR family, response regulator AdeR